MNKEGIKYTPPSRNKKIEKSKYPPQTRTAWYSRRTPTRTSVAFVSIKTHLSIVESVSIAGPTTVNLIIMCHTKRFSFKQIMNVSYFI